MNLNPRRKPQQDVTAAEARSLHRTRHARLGWKEITEEAIIHEGQLCLKRLILRCSFGPAAACAEPSRCQTLLSSIRRHLRPPGPTVVLNVKPLKQAKSPSHTSLIKRFIQPDYSRYPVFPTDLSLSGIQIFLSLSLGTVARMQSPPHRDCWCVSKAHAYKTPAQRRAPRLELSSKIFSSRVLEHHQKPECFFFNIQRIILDICK